MRYSQDSETEIFFGPITEKEEYWRKQRNISDSDEMSEGDDNGDNEECVMG